MIKINKSDFLLFPNILSLIRIILIIPTVILFFNLDKNRISLLIIALVSIILDNLDGYFARRFNQITELGKILDPLGDKLNIAVYAFGLYFNNSISFFLLFIIIIRDLLIIFGSLFFSNRIKQVLPSDRIGKITAFIIAIYLLYFMVGFEFLSSNTIDYLNLILLGLILISLINYIIRSYKILKKS